MLKAISSITLVAAVAAAPLPKADRDFLIDAAEGGIFEVKLAQVVVKQAASDDVKRFAQRMIDDHMKVNDRLAELARKDGVALPQVLDKKRQDHLDKLSRLNGAELDREYMDDVVSEHKDEVKAFEHKAKDGKDPGVKQFAAATLPTLEEHLSLAQQTQERIKK
jgi:putative membrane protein